MIKYYSTKTYGTDRGLSCCFRQWRADHSHCSLLHGYSIGIKLVFESKTLDEKNWVFDFGGLKLFKEWADSMFDHTLIIAKDDPQLEFFKHMANLGDPFASGTGTLDDVIEPHKRHALCDLRIVEGVGWEAFAKLCYDEMSSLLMDMKFDKSLSRYPVNIDVRLKSAEVFEHAGNSAIYEG